MLPEVQEYLQSAARAEESGDWSTAEQAYRSALEIQPNFPPLHAKLGLIYQFQGRFGEAVESIEKALTLDPKLPDAHFFLGLAYYSLYEYQKAIESFQQAISQNPENVKAQVYLGVCFLALQQTRQEYRAPGSGHRETSSRNWKHCRHWPRLT